jgi:hypothetical protein
VKLDLACGQNKLEGYTGVDFVETDHVDQVVNLLEFPWPWEDNSVEAVHCSHFVEHIPHQIGDSPKDGWFQFFDELWRVCKHDAECVFIHPYLMSPRAFWDPTHRRFIHDVTWWYLQEEWRKANNLDHYLVECKFEVVSIVPLTYNMTPGRSDFNLKSIEGQTFARLHYWNVYDDLQVILRAKKE